MFGLSLHSYDRYIVAFSGGKDSLACLLYLLEQGIKPSQIELWHHLVDGQESTLFDWACTEAYCRAVAEAFGIPIYMSWRAGGFEGELLKQDARTQAVCFEAPNGTFQVGGKRGKIATRRRYPQQAASLLTRWCSGCLKIDVSRAALCNQPRFNDSRTLFITGERAEESAARADYAAFEPHESDLRDSRKCRHIDRWRPVHGWSEAQVWAIIQSWGIDPHPAYKLGFSRCSCRACIFNQDAAWATLALLDPDGAERHCQLEDSFGWTIDRSGRSLRERIASAEPFPAAVASGVQPVIERALSFEPWSQPIKLGSLWQLPAGAYSSTGGPS